MNKRDFIQKFVLAVIQTGNDLPVTELIRSAINDYELIDAAVPEPEKRYGPVVLPMYSGQDTALKTKKYAAPIPEDELDAKINNEILASEGRKEKKESETEEIQCKNFMCRDNQMYYTEKLRGGCFTAESCPSYGYPKNCPVCPAFDRIDKACATSNHAVSHDSVYDREKALATENHRCELDAQKEKEGA